MRNSFLLSTSKIKRKLPVHPKVPTSTSPAFSCEGLPKDNWKKGETNKLARVPNFVSTTFLPKSSSLSVILASCAQSPENSVRKYLLLFRCSMEEAYLLRVTGFFS